MIKLSTKFVNNKDLTDRLLNTSYLNITYRDATLKKTYVVGSSSMQYAKDIKVVRIRASSVLFIFQI